MGMFGVKQQYGLPDYMTPGGGIGGGLENNQSAMMGMLGPQQVGPEFNPVQGDGSKPKPNMLKSLGMGLLGGALDGVARWGGAQPGYAGAMQQQQEQAAQEGKYQRERQDSITDMMLKAQLEQAYKVPELPAFAKDLQAAGIDPNSEQGRGLYQQYMTSRANPMVSAQGYDAQGNPVMNMFPRFPESQPQQQQPQQAQAANSDPKEALMYQAQEALRQGAPYDAVMRRLNEQLNAIGGQ